MDLGYKLIDVKLVEATVEAIRSGTVSIVGKQFVVAAGADLATLPEKLRLRIVGGNIVMDSPEAAEIREKIGTQDEG